MRHLGSSRVEVIVMWSSPAGRANFGLVLQLATGHYRTISIHTAGNRIGNARGMNADVIDDFGWMATPTPSAPWEL